MPHPVLKGELVGHVGDGCDWVLSIQNSYLLRMLHTLKPEREVWVDTLLIL